MAQQSITLQTSDADVVSGDVLGRVNFAASNESSGSEAKWIGASVFAEASGEFTATVNPTNLVFATSDADGVTARYKVTNVGHLIPNVTSTYNIGSSALKINNIFSATGTLDRVATTGIQLTGSASQSGLLYINNSNLISSSPNVLFSNADLASPKLIFKASGSLTPDVSLNILTTATNVASGVQTLSIQGSAGELFSITDVLDSGTIFSVNDISGLGLIEADADGTVTLVRYGSNVAVGNVVPTQKLHVAGNLRVSGAIFDSLNSPGTSGQVLVSTSGGTDWRSLGEITGVDGVGTSGYVARWIDTDTIGTGVIYDNGTNVGVSIIPSGAFHVARDINATSNFDNMQFIATSLSNPAKGITFGVDTTNNIGIIYGRTVGVGGLGIKVNGDSLWIGAGTNASVGIGTSAPSAKLHIASSSATTTGVIVRGAAAQTADLLQIQNSAGTTLLDIDSAGSLSGVGSGIFMQRLGVGTSSPAYKVDILTSGSNDGLRLRTVNNLDFATLRNSNSDSFPIGALILNYGNDPSAYIEGRSNSLFLRGGWTNGGTITFNPTTVGSTTAEIMRVNQTGVGIFTTSPTQALDVRGTGYFSESVRTSGTVVFASGNTGGVGVMQWNNGEGTVQLGLKGGNVNVELAQDNVVLCYNGVGSSLSKGQVVYASGAQGQRPSVNLALATSDLSSARTIGLVDETIGVGAEGFVATFGVVTNLNTSALTAGSGLWLSATTPGAITMTRPVAPNHGVFIGWCLNSHASAGRIFVNVQNGLELEELHDVLIQNVASGHLLQYDSSNSTWRNKTPLQAGLVEGVGTSGYVARWTGTNTIATGVVYDNGTNVGIGMTSPSSKLTIAGNLSVGYANENVTREIVIHSSSPFNEAGIIRQDGNSLNLLYSVANQSLNLGTSTVRWAFGINHYGGSHSFYGPVGASPIATISAVTSGVGINTTSPTARLHVETNAATATGVIIRGAAAQTADLFQVQNNAGTTLLDIDAAGSLSGVGSGIFMGRVGIGLSNPQTFLHISGDAPTVGTLFRLQNNLSTNKTYFDVRIGTAGNYDDHIFFNRNGINFFGATNSSDLYLPAHAKIEAGKQFQAYNNGNCFLELMSTPANSTSHTRLGYLSGGSFRILSSYNEVFRINGSGDVGIGTDSPTQKLDVRGSAFISGALYDSTNSAGTNGQVLTSTATGTDWKSLSEITGVDGVGTSGYVARWIDTDTIGTGIIYDNGTNVGIGTASPTSKLDVNGTILVSATGQSDPASEAGYRIKFADNGGIANDWGFGNDGLDIWFNHGVNSFRDLVGKAGNSTSVWELNRDGSAYFANSVAIGQATPTAKLHVQTNSATATGVIVRGAASQSADLQQWQDSAGTKTAYVDAGGNIYSSGIFRSTNVGNNSGFRMNYAALTETVSALSTIVGNNIIAGSTNSTVRRHASVADSGNFMQLMYDRGITFHTGLTSALNTDVAITTNERMRIALNGNVGIGTTSPAELFTVYGSNQNIQLQSATNAGSNAIIFADTAARFEIYRPASSSDLRFKSRNGGVGDVMTIGYTNGYVGIGTTNPQYLLDVSGTIRANHVTAITKSFLIEHPTKPGRQLRYASLEGPENGIYLRGSNSGNYIILPDYWCELVNGDSITVNLTPIGSYQQLWVKSKNVHYIEVGGVDGAYDYAVWAERKDVPRLEVEC